MLGELLNGIVVPVPGPAQSLVPDGQGVVQDVAQHDFDVAEHLPQRAGDRRIPQVELDRTVQVASRGARAGGQAGRRQMPLDKQRGR
jgi:hypothetical protein